jgi:hypothetical protein
LDGKSPCRELFQHLPPGRSFEKDYNEKRGADLALRRTFPNPVFFSEFCGGQTIGG